MLEIRRGQGKGLCMEKGATMPPHLVYIGTYTDPTRQAGFTVTPEKPIMGMTGPTGSAGIYVFQQDPITGALTHLHTLGGMINPGASSSP